MQALARRDRKYEGRGLSTPTYLMLCLSDEIYSPISNRKYQIEMFSFNAKTSTTGVREVQKQGEAAQQWFKFPPLTWNLWQKSPPSSKRASPWRDACANSNSATAATLSISPLHQLISQFNKPP